MKKMGLIIPAYNAELYISKCLDSILCQTITDAQIIIVNDCSTDNTLAILRKYSALFIEKGFEYILISLKQNEGQASCMNHGLARLNSKYFMWLDSDDFMYPDCFEKKINYMEENASLDLCICNADCYIYPDYDHVIGKLERANKDYNYFKQVLLMGDVVWLPGTICVKTSFLFQRLKEKQIYPSREGQNIQFLLPLLYKSHYEYLDESLVSSVAHSDSHSRTNKTIEQKVSRRLEMLNIYDKTLASMNLSFFKRNYFYCIIRKRINKTIFYLYFHGGNYLEAKKYYRRLPFKSKIAVIKFFIIKRLKRKFDK